MAIVTHIRTLEEKRDQLKALIAQESTRPMPDFTRITDYKKQKLALKEEIARLARDSQIINKKTG